MAKPESSEVTRVDFRFRRKLAEKLEGNLVSFCYQCGACVGDCPAATYSGGVFNPREIMLKALYGMADELIKDDSIVWTCTSCYNCLERCPQQVKPVEVILAIKNMLADEGYIPVTVRKVTDQFRKTGRTVPPSPAIDRQRARFGLPPLTPVPMDEIRAILGAEEPDGPRTDVEEEKKP